LGGQNIDVVDDFNGLGMFLENTGGVKIKTLFFVTLAKADSFLRFLDRSQLDTHARAHARTNARSVGLL
jgi:hypothetical protein